MHKRKRSIPILSPVFPSLNTEPAINAKFKLVNKRPEYLSRLFDAQHRTFVINSNLTKNSSLFTTLLQRQQYDLCFQVSCITTI